MNHGHHILLTDARDLGPGEKILLGEAAVTHLTDVRDMLNYALPDKPLYIHSKNDSNG